MKSDSTDAAEYLARLPEDRRRTVEAVRQTILDHLPDGYEEMMQYGMLSYVVPLDRFADTYNGQALGVAALANQKNHVSLYLMGVYADDAEREWFQQAWKSTGHKLNMGKSCVRFTGLDKVPLDVIGEAVARVSVDDMIAAHERVHGN